MNEGKKDRRDPIRTIKPRNFVAKNAGATTSGAGAHKDKKKATTQVRGAKHKKDVYAEHLDSLLSKALVETQDFCRICGCSPCNCTHITNEGWGAEKQQRDLEASNARWAPYVEKYKDDPVMSDYFKFHRIYGGNTPEQAEAKALADVKAGKKLPDFWTNPKPTGGYKLAEDDDMEKLNAWKQEVLKAYPQIAGKVKFKGIGNQISAEVPGIDRSFGVFDLDTMSGDVLGETKVRWTHDSLADQLFEHERTYEEELTNKLAKVLNRK